MRILSKGSSIIKRQSEPKSSERPWLPNLVFKNWSIVIKNTHAVVDCRFWSKLFCWRDFSLETSLSSYQTETFWKLLTWQRNILQKCENALKKNSFEFLMCGYTSETIWSKSVWNWSLSSPRTKGRYIATRAAKNTDEQKLSDNQIFLSDAQIVLWKVINAKDLLASKSACKDESVLKIGKYFLGNYWKSLKFLSKYSNLQTLINLNLSGIKSIYPVGCKIGIGWICKYFFECKRT